MNHIITYESRIGLYCLRMEGCRVRFNVSRDYFERLLFRHHRASVYKDYIETHDLNQMRACFAQWERLKIRA